MAKIKFKLSVKELSFEFEGDQETGVRFQNSISKTLNSLTDTPNQVIDVEAKTISDNYLLSQTTNPTRKRSNKRKKPTSSESVLSNGNSELEEKIKRTNRPKGQSCRDQVIILLQNGYFTQFRAVPDILEALTKKGHNFNSNELTPTLLRLTKQNHLERDNASGTWHYKKGSVDVPAKS